MLFILITMIFSLIAITAWFGDYEEKERKKDYEKYWEIVKGDK